MFKTLSNDELVTATGGINFADIANTDSQAHIGGPLINRPPSPPTIPPLTHPGHPGQPKPSPFDPTPGPL